MSVWDGLSARRSTRAVASHLASGETPHAWLLLGPTGSGKRPVALAMAAALECIEEPGVGCGVCSTCARIARRRHPDVRHIVPEGPLIPVDVIRETVVPEAARSPFEGTTKVFIIEEADRMNHAAQNALLKTLEEPQPDTVFVLTSEHEEELLETIRSRCLIARLEPLGRAEVVQALRAEGVDAETAAFAARLSDGDVERARALAFDLETGQRRRLWTSIPRRLISPIDALDAAAEVIDVARGVVKDLEADQKQEIVDLAEALGEGRGTASARQALLKRHKREARRAEQEVLSEALRSVASFYRDVIAFRAGGAEAVTNEDLLAEIDTWASSSVADVNLVEAIEACLRAQADLPLNANALLALEAAFLNAGRLAGAGPVAAAS